MATPGGTVRCQGFTETCVCPNRRDPNSPLLYCEACKVSVQQKQGFLTALIPAQYEGCNKGTPVDSGEHERRAAWYAAQGIPVIRVGG